MRQVAGLDRTHGHLPPSQRARAGRDHAVGMKDREAQRRERAIEALKHYRRVASAIGRAVGTGTASGMPTTSSEP
jgi:hypothetical protein